MVDVPTVSSSKCTRFDIMCGSKPLSALLVTCCVLVGARAEFGFRQLFENNETSTFNNTSNSTLTNNWAANDDATAASNSTNSTSPSNTEGRIIGGQVALDRAQFPYQASLRQHTIWGNFAFCGATIIDQQHLLTAAHCVVSENGVVMRPSAIFSVVGDLNVVQPNTFTVRRAITHIFTHPNYNPNTIQHDVAILRVEQTFGGWTAFVSPLPLATRTPPDHTNCTVSGWGVTETGFTSNVLRFVSVPIVPLSTCRAAYGNSLLSGMICAGFLQGGRDACQGDSGGPLACLNSLAGVVSWGYDCARPGFPGVYADVAIYRNWIIQQTQRSSSETMTTLSVFALVLAILSAAYGSL